MTVTHLFALLIFLLYPSLALAANCPTCTAEELYQKDMKLMKQMGEDMKALDETLSGLSPQAIATLEKMMGDLDDQSVAAQAMKIAIAQRKGQLADEQHKKERERIAELKELETLKLQKATVEAEAAQARKPKDPLALLASAGPSVKGQPGASKPKLNKKLQEDFAKGLYVTFVYESDEPEKRAVVISADGKAISLKIGSHFSYRGDKYELVAIKPATNRADKRKWNVLVKSSAKTVLQALNWAG